MEFKIDIINQNFPFILQTVKGESGKEHLLFFNGTCFHKIEKKELENLIVFAKNTIDNFENVDDFIFRKNKELKEEMSNRYRSKEIKTKNLNTGFIYIVKCNSTNFYKIGKAKCVETRIKQLKTANANIELFKSYEVKNVILEKQLHEYFIKKNVNREWFNLDEKDLRYIDKFLKNNYEIFNNNK